MKLKFFTVAAVIAATTCISAWAEELKPAAPAKPAEAAPTADRIFAPTELEALKAAMGKKVIVEGTIAASGANKTESIRYLNFTKNYKESISLVFFANMGGGTFTKDKLAEFVGKKVRVNGVVGEHTGNLQIKMESLDQIKVQPAEAAPAPTPAAK